MLEERRGLVPVVERFDIPRFVTGKEGERERANEQASKRGTRAERTRISSCQWFKACGVKFGTPSVLVSPKRNHHTGQRRGLAYAGGETGRETKQFWLDRT